MKGKNGINGEAEQCLEHLALMRGFIFSPLSFKVSGKKNHKKSVFSFLTLHKKNDLF